MSGLTKNQSLSVFLFAALVMQSMLIDLNYHAGNNLERSMEHVEESTFWTYPVTQPHGAVVGKSFLDNTTTPAALDRLEGSTVRQGAAHEPPFSSLCEWAAHQNPIQLWTEQFPTILEASRLSPLTEHDWLQSVTASVLEEVTVRLPRSIKTLPTTDFSPVMEKLERRYRYLLDPDSFAEAPPPVTVAIFGGSVTGGNNCYTGIQHLQERSCAWPARLDQFLHALVQSTLPQSNTRTTTATTTTEPPRLVNVVSLAMGATNTAIGRMLIEYDLWPGIPDILINSYSTNDNHEQTMLEAADANLSFREQILTMNQNFVRTLYKRAQCSNKTILLYWLDDYLGNVERKILVNHEVAQVLHVLSNYYGFGFFSYADAVRDAVYSNTMEDTFSPGQWYDQSNLAAGMRQQVHPGQGMHMATAWITAYNLFSTMVTHCSVQSFRAKLQKETNGDKLQTHRREEENPVAVRNSGMPPPLTKNLTLDEVSELWRRAASAEPDCNLVRSGTKQCPFSWVSGLPLTDDTWIQEYFQNVAQSPLEWAVIDDSNSKYKKYGWMPLANVSKPKLVMEFNAADHVADNIQSVTLFFLKSYGPKWSGSTATAMIEKKVPDAWVPAQATPLVLTGSHNKKTSENYAETVYLLKNETVASALRLTLTHTGGETFKLMGVAVCQ